MKTCPNCQAQMPEGAQFCSRCGAVLPVERFCAYCGQKLEADAKFCITCGTNLQGDPAPVPAPKKKKKPESS